MFRSSHPRHRDRIPLSDSAVIRLAVLAAIVISLGAGLALSWWSS